MERMMEMKIRFDRKMIEWFCPAKYGVPLYRRFIRNQRRNKEYARDMRAGYYIKLAKSRMYYIVLVCSIIVMEMYGIPLILITPVKYFDMMFLLALIAGVVTIGWLYHTVEKMVFKKERYIRFFKKFEKKDKAWFNKWKSITRWLQIGLTIGVFAIPFLLIAIFNIFGTS